jgi:hypothetical protein
LHLLVVEEIVVHFLPVDHLEFLTTGGCEERDEDLWGRGGEEGQFAVGAGGVLLDLVPQQELLLL